MRPSPITLAILLLLPAPAFACAWTKVAAAPQFFIWWSVPLFALAGFALRLKFDVRKSLLPVAVAVGCVISSAALGELQGNGAWGIGTAPLALVALLVPLAAVYLIRSKFALTVVTALVFTVSAFIADSESSTRAMGFQPSEVKVEVVF